MKKISFFDAKSYDKKFFNEHNKKYNFQIEYLEDPLTKDSIDQAKNSDVICIFVKDDVDKDAIDLLVKNGVKLIALRCAGFNNIDLKYAKGKIKIVRASFYSKYAVAEHAMALILSLIRKTHKYYTKSRLGNFSLEGLLGFDIGGKTIGIVGTGNIGKTMIDIAEGFRMKILANDLYPDENLIKDKKCDYVSFDELIKNSDIISLHCPLTDKNEHMINKDTINKMKDNVIIINTGRGKLIKSEDLIAALKSKKVYGAGLDVYEEESYFYHDFSSSIITDDLLARLMFFPNVIITSHQGFFTEEALENIATTTLFNISQFFENKKMDNEIEFF